MIAIEQLAGGETGSDELIRVGLDALLAGVDTPSLPLLAGLTRGEEPEARGLFNRVAEELGLVPQGLPDEPTARAWALVRWPAQLILDGDLSVARGGQLIWWHSDHIPDTYVEGLRPLLRSIALYDDEIDAWPVWDTDYLARHRDRAVEIVNEAREFLARPEPA